MIYDGDTAFPTDFPRPSTSGPYKAHQFEFESLVFLAICIPVLVIYFIVADWSQQSSGVGDHDVKVSRWVIWIQGNWIHPNQGQKTSER